MEAPTIMVTPTTPRTASSMGDEAVNGPVLTATEEAGKSEEEAEQIAVTDNDGGVRPRSHTLKFEKSESVDLSTEHLLREKEVTENESIIRNINRTILGAFSMDGEHVEVLRLFTALSTCGLIPFKDPRLVDLVEGCLITKTGVGEKLYTSINLVKHKPLPWFETMSIKAVNIINRSLLGDLVIPNFQKFAQETTALHATCQLNNTGSTADHIPQLFRADPNNWGMAICTIDGQRTAKGNSNVPVTLQACSGAINYALAVTQYGSKKVHEHVGKEPCEFGSDSITLDKNNLPHNPLMQSGAMSVVSLLLQEHSDLAETFDDMHEKYEALAGGGHISVNNAVFIAEKAISDRKFSIGYLLKEQNVFPEETCMATVLDLYFQLCAMEITCESGAVIAATLANGGTCPITDEKVLSHRAVQNTLSIMHMNGMYGFSGEWMFDIGLPAKSSSSGLILVVVPGVLGMCLWSPSLDQSRNSARGVQFTRLLTHTFALQDNHTMSPHNKYNIINRRQGRETSEQIIMNIIFAAANGDIGLLTRYFDQGVDLSVCDYDGRTALHLASTTGRSTIVRCLVEVAKVEVNPMDRWNHTPFDDAQHNKFTDIQHYLASKGGYEGPGVIQVVNEDCPAPVKSKPSTPIIQRTQEPIPIHKTLKRDSSAGSKQSTEPGNYRDSPVPPKPMTPVHDS